MRVVLELYIDHQDGDESERSEVVDELLNNLDLMEFTVGSDSWYVVRSAHTLEEGTT
jgi:hypothetical protein